MTKSTDMMAPSGTTHTIKSEFKKSPLWPRIKALGNKCFYFNGSQWMAVLDENYLDYYLKFYDPVQYEEILTETPEEAEAFNKMKPYEFDEHVSGDAKRVKSITRYVTVPVTVEGYNGDKIAYTTKEIAQAMQHEPVFTQAMADAGELPQAGSYYNAHGVTYVSIATCEAQVCGRSADGYLSLNQAGECNPTDNRTSKQKAVDELAKLILSKGSLNGELFGVSILAGIIINDGYEKKC